MLMDKLRDFEVIEQTAFLEVTPALRIGSMKKSQLINHIYQVLDSHLHNPHFFQKAFTTSFHLESKFSSSFKVFKMSLFQQHTYCTKGGKAWF